MHSTVCRDTAPHTLLLVCSLALDSQEAGGERQWRLVRKPLPGRMKRKEKSPLVESVMPHCSASLSLSVHICAQSGSTHPAERLLYHRPHSAFPTPHLTDKEGRDRVTGPQGYTPGWPGQVPSGTPGFSGCATSLGRDSGLR